MIEVWGAVPVGLIQHLDLRHSQYGYIGLSDYFMYPLLRPGSFVQIDSKVRRPQKGVFQSEFDRPIYFIELRDGYACSWCQLAGSNLLLIPHSLSSCDVQLFSYGIEAEIVGQVTGVAMRIVDSGSQSPSTAPDPKTKLGLRDAIDGDPSG